MLFGPQPPEISLSSRAQSLLEYLVRCPTTPQNYVERATIILTLHNTDLNNTQAGRKLNISRGTIGKWRTRWIEGESVLSILEAEGECDKELLKKIKDILSDDPRSGAPATFTPEQIVQIIAVACENPKESGRPITHWTNRELAEEVIKRGIVESISSRQIGRFLQEADLKPHLTRYWLNNNPDDPEAFKSEVKEVCDTYAQALELKKSQGTNTASTDEKTGIQALERAFPTKPAKPGLIERREYEYIRHDTLCLIVNLDVVTGKVIMPYLNPTRTEEDFANHIRQTIETDPENGWIFIVDQLNTHMSESLVRLVAEKCHIDKDLGIKGKKGILKSMETRKKFLQDKNHSIRFVYTPKHTSWLNQIEIWFSILVRKLLKRASFTSLEELRQRILDFIDYFNKTMAKPFKWTYKGSPLKA